MPKKKALRRVDLLAIKSHVHSPHPWGVPCDRCTPHARTLIAEVERLTAEIGLLTSPPVVAEPADALAGYVEVVTRYGAVKHLARGTASSQWEDGRYLTLCLGTSAWTLASWEANPDHPTLTLEEIKALPPCPRCADRLRPATPKD